MKHYETAVKFEKACNVRRALEAAGRKPTIEDDRYINELRLLLDKIDIVAAGNWETGHLSKCPNCSNAHMVHSILCVPAAYR